MTQSPYVLKTLRLYGMLMKKEEQMPSNTKKTELRRKKKKAGQAKKRKKVMSKMSTPVFDIHVSGNE